MDGFVEDTYGQYGKRGDGNNNVKCIIFWKKKKTFCILAEAVSERVNAVEQQGVMTKSGFWVVLVFLTKAAAVRDWWQVGVFDQVLLILSLFFFFFFIYLFIFYFMRHHSVPLFLLFNSFHFPNHFLSIFQPFPPPFATIAPLDSPSPPLLTTTLLLSYLPLSRPQISPANSTSTNIASFSREIPGLFHLGLFVRPV